jgi:hypothetical protein
MGLWLVQVVNAQFCGTPQAPLLERTDAHKASLQVIQRGVVKYIPITFHLVANTAGTGRIIEDNVLRQVANINEQFADQEIIFYIDRFNYFNNDAVYETPNSAAATTQMRLRKDNNSVNVFITNKADSGNGGPGVTLAYYDPQEDWIVARKANIGGGSSTLAHELGHFFSLAHPHAGWDCFPFTLEDYTNPVNVDFTLPCNDGGGGSVRIELQNGSNCNTAGDHICDTPPDYNLGLLFQNDCDQNTIVRDKNGELITPMTNNFMGYYTNCSDYEFTTTQKSLMNTDFFSLQRLYIRTGVIPNTDSVEGPAVLLSPINNQETSGPTDILLDWENVAGAEQYMVIIDRLQSFTFTPQRFFVDESHVVIDALLPGVTYFWKVWPYNESQTGEGYSAAESFVVGTGVGVNEISDINAYAILPNPASEGVDNFLSLTSANAFKADLILSDASGKVISKESISIPAGSSQHVLQTRSLHAGIYFVTLHSSQGILVERLLKTNSF